MDALNKLEAWLGSLYKGAPPLSPDGKKSIVTLWPWVALFFGALQLWAALALWHWGHTVNSLVNNLNANYTTSVGRVGHLNSFYWISLIVLVVDGVILLMAFPKLRTHAKSGWKLLFYGALLNLVYGVFSAFNDYSGFGNLILQIIVTGMILYFLFQIRDHYHSAK